MPSNNPFPEAFLLSLPLPVGEAVLLLLLILSHGTHPQRPPDPGGEPVAEVDGEGGVGDHKWAQ